MQWSGAMPKGDKSACTERQKRKAQHIEEGYEERGVPGEEAERRGWATVNKESGGGRRSGSGVGREVSHVSLPLHPVRRLRALPRRARALRPAPAAMPPSAIPRGQ